MDSMRSLNSSLPSSVPSQSAPSDLLQAFRSAALSVTNLYKSAAADQANSRQAGYQDALEDLLKFLDDENLGVQDGEGWRIRQWATQRYDGGNYQQQSDTDDSNEPDGRSHKRPGEQGRRESSKAAEDQKDRLEQDKETTVGRSPSPPVFSFTGNTISDHTMHTDRSSSPELINQPSSSSSSSSSAQSASFHVEVLNGHSKPAKSTSGRHSARPNSREFTFTAGTKRKLHFPDFFDLSNIPEKRDPTSGSHGPKRGRLL